jgi:hypothetical protein
MKRKNRGRKENRPALLKNKLREQKEKKSRR